MKHKNLRGRNPLKTDIVVAAVKKYKMLSDKPLMPKIALARLLYKENKAMFKTIDDARHAVRYHTGADGIGSRTNMEKKTGKPFTLPPPNYTPYKIPESFAEEWTPYVLPNNANDILILSDVHLPYHNVEATQTAIDYGKENNVNTIILNGDILDFYQLSRFDKNPNNRSFAQELESGRTFLRYLRQEFPDAFIYYKLGNHEERYEKFLYGKAKELLDIDDFMLHILLRFGELNINLITDKRIIEAGHLNILHGHEFIGAVMQSVNPARGLFNRTFDSCIIGHLHKSSENCETSLSGKMITTWSTGSLCDLHPDYARINRWNHGFAHVKVNADKSYKVKNIRIDNGKIY